MIFEDLSGLKYMSTYQNKTKNSFLSVKICVIRVICVL